MPSDESVGDTERERYELAHEVGPKDSGEIYDYVVKNGPISSREIFEDTGWMATDDISRSLDALKDAGLIDTIPGDFDKHGTTGDLWVADKTSTEADRDV